MIQAICRMLSLFSISFISDSLIALEEPSAGRIACFSIAATLIYFICKRELLKIKSSYELDAINQQIAVKAAEQKVIEKALEESQKIFSGAFNDAPIGVVLVSLEGCFIKVNKATTRMLGYSREELLATNLKSIIHPDDLKSDQSLIKDLISGTRRFYQSEKRYFHKLGHIVFTQLSVSLLRDADDNPLFFIVHIQDISERKRTQASLQKAIKLSKAANEAKSNFLAMMSHEIRTPMNAMLGMAELLEETTLNQQQQDFVSTIRTSGTTLLTVINDILDFSKIESNKLELEATRLDLDACINNVLSLFHNQARQKGISLTSLIEPDNMPTAFKGDCVRLQQILTNLVSNSIKFTQQGEVSVHARIESIEPEAILSSRGSNNAPETANPYYRIQFAIKDTGIGIAPDKIPHLFEPFNQIDASMTRQYGGTGLGLTISKQLVEIMGGKMWVESTPNEGSTFYFSIKLEGYRQSGVTRAFREEITLAPDFSVHKPLRILLTEDIALNQKVALQMLATYGYEAEVANNGVEAIKAIENESYDLVFMDVQMPVMDGIEATRKIRAMTASIHQPYIVATTAHAMQGDREDCLLAGMNSYIRKPICKRELAIALMNCPTQSSAKRPTIVSA